MFHTLAFISAIIFTTLNDFDLYPDAVLTLSAIDLLEKNSNIKPTKCSKLVQCFHCVFEDF